MAGQGSVHCVISHQFQKIVSFIYACAGDKGPRSRFLEIELLPGSCSSSGLRRRLGPQMRRKNLAWWDRRGSDTKPEKVRAAGIPGARHRGHSLPLVQPDPQAF